MKKKAPPKKAIIDPRVGRTVWIACRASYNCPGRNCTVKRVFKLPQGGKSIHYHCETCKKGFAITF